MTINKTKEGDALTIALEGRLDTVTAPQLEGELRTAINGVKELVFDLKKLDYVSSAGLRVLLSAQKVMNRQGSMVIRNVQEQIMDIFDTLHARGMSIIMITHELAVAQRASAMMHIYDGVLSKEGVR